jgi:aminopeptidase N
MLNTVGLDQGTSPWRRLAATKTIHEIREGLKEAGGTEDKVAMLKTLIDKIKEMETVSDLTQIYQQYGN